MQEYDWPPISGTKLVSWTRQNSLDRVETSASTNLPATLAWNNSHSRNIKLPIMIAFRRRIGSSYSHWQHIRYSEFLTTCCPGIVHRASFPDDYTADGAEASGPNLSTDFNSITEAVEKYEIYEDCCLATWVRFLNFTIRRSCQLDFTSGTLLKNIIQRRYLFTPSLNTLFEHWLIIIISHLLRHCWEVAINCCLALGKLI